MNEPPSLPETLAGARIALVSSSLFSVEGGTGDLQNAAREIVQAPDEFATALLILTLV
jgi:hypothetical protein